MFKSYYFPYVWVEVVKKLPHTSPSAFDHFAGRPRGLCLIVFLLCVAVTFYISLGLSFLLNILSSFYLERAVGLVIEYV